MFACLVPLQQEHFDSLLILLLCVCHLCSFCVTAVLLIPNVKNNDERAQNNTVSPLPHFHSQV